MNKLALGIQIYTVRDDFKNNPLETLKRLSALGYEAVELTTMVADWDPLQLKEWFDEAGLRCCGMTTGWSYVLPDKIDSWIEFNKRLGNDRFVVGSAPLADLRERDALKNVIKILNEVYEKAKANGFATGYHAHSTDFFMVDGVSSWDRIMQNTPDDFSMVIDTGNMLSAGADPIHYINKYPGRSPLVHLKPFDAKGATGATMIGEDSFDWNILIDTCINTGSAHTLIVEYSNTRRFDPWTASEMCYDKITKILKDKKYI